MASASGTGAAADAQADAVPAPAAASAPADDVEQSQKAAAAGAQETMAEAFEIQLLNARGVWVPMYTDALFCADEEGAYPLPYESLNHGLVLPQGWWWRRGVKWTVSMGDGYDLKGWEYGRALEGPFDAIRRTEFGKRSKFRRRRWVRPIFTIAPVSLIDPVDGVKECVRLHAVRHMALIVHGVGTHDRRRMTKKTHQLRRLVKVLRRTGFDVGSVDVDFSYVSWNDGVTNEQHISQDLAAVALDTIPAIRGILYGTLGDALAYMGDFSETMKARCLASFNYRYHVFKATHPFYTPGPVALVCHSLGCVIAYDTLAVHNPGLDFPVGTFLNAGSPLGLFMAVRRGGRSAFRGALNLLHSRGTRLYNVFHRCDPIAGKLEPLTLSRDARAPGPHRRLVANHSTESCRRMFRAAATRLREAQLLASEARAQATLPDDGAPAVAAVAVDAVAALPVDPAPPAAAAAGASTPMNVPAGARGAAIDPPPTAHHGGTSPTPLPAGNEDASSSDDADFVMVGADTSDSADAGADATSDTPLDGDEPVDVVVAPMPERAAAPPPAAELVDVDLNSKPPPIPVRRSRGVAPLPPHRTSVSGAGAGDDSSSNAPGGASEPTNHLGGFGHLVAAASVAGTTPAAVVAARSDGWSAGAQRPVSVASAGAGAGAGAGASVGAGKEQPELWSAGSTDTPLLSDTTNDHAPTPASVLQHPSRIDFELEHRTQSLADLNDYLAAGSAHKCYWKEPDFMAFLCRCLMEDAAAVLERDVAATLASAPQ